MCMLAIVCNQCHLDPCSSFLQFVCTNMPPHFQLHYQHLMPSNSFLGHVMSGNGQRKAHIRRTYVQGICIVRATPSMVFDVETSVTSMLCTIGPHHHEG